MLCISLDVLIPTLFISSVIGLGGAEPWPVGANPNRLAAVAGFGRTSVAAAGDLWPTAWPLRKGIPGLRYADTLPQIHAPPDSTPVSNTNSVYEQRIAGGSRG